MEEVHHRQQGRDNQEGQGEEQRRPRQQHDGAEQVQPVAEGAGVPGVTGAVLRP